jgi:hypothetical protein
MIGVPVEELKPVVGDHTYDEAPEALSVSPVPLLHIAEDEDEAPIAGKGLTVTITLVVSAQFLPASPAKVYVVVVAGLAITEPPVVVFNPVEGDHV